MNQKTIEILQFSSEGSANTLLSAQAKLPVNYNLLPTVTDFSSIESVVKDKSIDVVLIDLSKSMVNYISKLQALLTQFPQLNVLVYTNSDHSMDFISSFRIGVKGYFLKPKPFSELLCYIEIVSLGNVVLDQSLTSSFQSTLQSTLQSPLRQNFFVTLTHRENQIIWLVAQGLKNKDIAQECGITEKTVRNSISKVLKKMGYIDRRDAIQKLRGIQSGQVMFNSINKGQ